MLLLWYMDNGYDHTGRIVIIAVTVRSAAGRRCTETISGIKMAYILSAPIVEPRWTGGIVDG
jgi:hypothetical protein